MVDNEEIDDKISGKIKLTEKERDYYKRHTYGRINRNTARKDGKKRTWKAFFGWMTRTEYNSLRVETLFNQEYRCGSGSHCIIAKMKQLPYFSLKDVKGFEMHHIDQNHYNNLDYNRVVLCPFCHSLMSNYPYEFDNKESFTKQFEKHQQDLMLAEKTTLLVDPLPIMEKKLQSNLQPESIIICEVSADVTYTNFQDYKDMEERTKRFMHNCMVEMVDRFHTNPLADPKAVQFFVYDMFKDVHAKWYPQHNIISIANLHGIFKVNKQYYSLAYHKIRKAKKEDTEFYNNQEFLSNDVLMAFIELNKKYGGKLKSGTSKETRYTKMLRSMQKKKKNQKSA